MLMGTAMIRANIEETSVPKMNGKRAEYLVDRIPVAS